MFENIRIIGQSEGESMRVFVPVRAALSVLTPPSGSKDVCPTGNEQTAHH